MSNVFLKEKLIFAGNSISDLFDIDAIWLLHADYGVLGVFEHLPGKPEGMKSPLHTSSMVDYSRPPVVLFV